MDLKNAKASVKISMATGRNYTLDVIKLLAAYMVVFIHVPFWGVFGDIVNLFAKVAVPVFFMTSGYFCYEKDSKTILRRLKKIVVILVFASVLYNLSNILLAYVSGGTAGVIEYFAVFGDLGRWLLLIFLNVPFSATRLWFLLALIYVYLVQLLMVRLKVSYKAILAISVCGLIFHILIGNSSLIFGIDLPDHICRNFLLFGYPFFGIGLLFRHHEKMITEIGKKYLILLAVFGVILSFLPMLYKSNSQIGIGTVMLVLVIFCMSLKGSDIRYPAWVIKVSECSLGIYIIHRPVTTVAAKALSVLRLAPGTVIYSNLLPILVCIASTVAVLLWNTVRTGKSVRHDIRSNKNEK